MLAFAAILIGGLCGGLIGYGFTDLPCAGDCATLAGGTGLLGAVLGAVGVGVVAVLALRAMGEWRTTERRDDELTARLRSRSGGGGRLRRGRRRPGWPSSAARCSRSSATERGVAAEPALVAGHRGDLRVEHRVDVDPRVGLERARRAARARPGGPGPASGK